MLVIYDLGVLENVTCHSLWEDQQGFLRRHSTATPTTGMLHVLRELFPDVPDYSFEVRSTVGIENGTAHAGDIVCF